VWNMSVAPVDAVVAAFDTADHVVVMTGAGVSTASGIPSFRGDDGIWGAQFDPNAFHISRFERDPAGFWTDRLALYEQMLPAGLAPNPAHEALAALESAGRLDAVITQNTDGLHRAAGTTSLIELHGTTAQVRCHRCDAATPAEPVHQRIRDGENPPHCPCGGVYKPDVILFGELLDREALSQAKSLIRETELLIVAGSSLTVQPAAGLPRGRNGADLVLINYDRTPYTETADIWIDGDVSTVLPAIAAALVE